MKGLKRKELGAQSVARSAFQIIVRTSLGAGDGDEEGKASCAAVIMPRKKARVPPSKTGAVGNGECSLPTLASCFACPGTQ